MHYTIYKITNNVNGKVYVGKHQTGDLNDGYMGSGKLVRRAITKYGVDKFTKEILHVFDTEQEMNDKEAEIVTEDFCKEANYNLCKGGTGGFGYINSKVLSGDQRKLGRKNADAAMLARFGPDYRKEIGRRGYAAKLKKYGVEHLREESRANIKPWTHRSGASNQSAKRVQDDQGNVFDTMQDYARFHGITPDGATRRLKHGINIKRINAGVA